MERHQLTRQYIDRRYDSSIAAQYASFANSIEFETLPDDVDHQAKRILLDALGCAIGTYDSPGKQPCEALVEDLGGNEQSTVWGTGMQTSAPNAALFNSFLVRYLDYNDLGGGGHNSDAIPSIIAICEKLGAGGDDFITSLVISYEIGQRFIDGIHAGGTGENDMERHGWNKDIRAGISMPPALGTLMGLSEEEIANAIGCCASRNQSLKILDANREEFNMTKNLRFGGIAADAIRCCILAKHGFTGPIRVVEGDFGMNEVMLSEELDTNAMLDYSGWRILDTKFKDLPVNITTQGHVAATIENVTSNDIDPEEIESIRIEVGPREYRHTASLEKKYPRNGETGDHSAYYATAVAIRDRTMNADSYKDENFDDPVILDLIDRMTVAQNSEMEEMSYAGVSEITTKSGETFRTEVDAPSTFADSSLSDERIEEKFAENAGKFLSDDRIAEITDVVWDLESVDDMRELTELMVFD
jgi:2-methylcitrate dehydratase